MSGVRVKRLDWGRRALDAYLATLGRIASENPRTAYLVEERVNHAIALILAHPGLGTPSPRRNERGFAIPNTGHVIHYRVFAGSIRITIWCRARQGIRR